jgi:3'-5' exoribonuclease
MEKKQFIRELTPGGTVDGLFLLASAQQKEARNGPYWRIEFRDASGSMESKIWSPLSQQFPHLKAGLLAEVQGRVVVFRERKEIAVDSMRLLDEKQSLKARPEDFMPSRGLDGSAMFMELEELCRQTFTRTPWKKFYRLVLKDEEISSKLPFFPAAKSMHHAYSGGLLEHTLGVCRAALGMADLYPRLDRQTLLAGGLCHDLGKIRELSSGLGIDYTSAGRLAGHIALGLEMLSPLLRKSELEEDLVMHLRHLVLSHHGALEFGSPCLPATAEALALHFADNLDAKMNQTRTALEMVPEGESGWSDFVPGLNRHLFQPAAPPRPEFTPGEPKSGQTRRESQCSLLSKE